MASKSKTCLLQTRIFHEASPIWIGVFVSSPRNFLMRIGDTYVQHYDFDSLKWLIVTIPNRTLRHVKHRDYYQYLKLREKLLLVVTDELITQTGIKARYLVDCRHKPFNDPPSYLANNHILFIRYT